ncbi:MAG: 16S rRNA processing protein RimM [Myxococcales bacterium]|nr:16S rRNA processing protein RimM [Myxococcales bacterium]
MSKAASHETSASPTGEALIGLGKITRPHGIRGEVRVQPYWVEGDTLETADELWLRTKSDLTRVEVRGVRRANKALLMDLGCDDRNAAELLRGAEVCVPRQALPALEPGEYYLVDLLGASVECAGETVGEVIELRTHPSVDAVVIRTASGKLREQVLAEPWVAKVDAAGKRLVLSSLDGLI